MANILIYGSEETDMVDNVSHLLKKQHHSVQVCKPSQRKMPKLSTEDANVVILDTQLRWTDCRPLLSHCEKHDCSVLFVTNNSQMKNHLYALYKGRRDVLTMPMNYRILNKKLQSLAPQKPRDPQLVMDHTTKTVTLDGHAVILTEQEFALFKALFADVDTAVSREKLLREAWGYQSMGETRTVDVHVQRLRKKLGAERIETVYRCGYRLHLA